jgi:predicted ester cyclase
MGMTREQSMSVEKNKEIVRRYYEEVVNTRNVDVIEDFISEEYTEVIDGKRHSVGVEGAKAHVIGVRQTYPDLHLSIERQIAEDEWVGTCITAQGTHMGSWLGIKPTGKPVAFTGVNVDRVVGDELSNMVERQTYSGRCLKSVRSK